METIDFKSNKWDSDIANSFERMYNSQQTLNDKLNFIITCFLEYRNEHSFGEYDFMVIIEEEVQIEREEISNFLIEKFTELKIEINKITGKVFDEKIKAEYEIKKSVSLNAEMTKYGFFELEKIKKLSDPNKQKLVELISSKHLPYKIAMLDFLGFFTHLEKEHFHHKYRLHQEVARWFNSDKGGRAVKGNINSLSTKTNENKDRYTAHKYKKTVSNDYSKLK